MIASLPLGFVLKPVPSAPEFLHNRKERLHSVTEIAKDDIRADFGAPRPAREYLIPSAPLDHDLHAASKPGPVQTSTGAVAYVKSMSGV